MEGSGAMAHDSGIDPGPRDVEGCPPVLLSRTGRSDPKVVLRWYKGHLYPSHHLHGDDCQQFRRDGAVERDNLPASVSRRRDGLRFLLARVSLGLAIRHGHLFPAVDGNIIRQIQPQDRIAAVLRYHGIVVSTVAHVRRGLPIGLDHRDFRLVFLRYRKHSDRSGSGRGIRTRSGHHAKLHDPVPAGGHVAGAHVSRVHSFPIRIFDCLLLLVGLIVLSGYGLGVRTHTQAS